MKIKIGGIIPDIFISSPKNLTIDCEVAEQGCLCVIPSRTLLVVIASMNLLIVNN
jgi:hypothetical protein